MISSKVATYMGDRFTIPYFFLRHNATRVAKKTKPKNHIHLRRFVLEPNLHKNQILFES